MIHGLRDLVVIPSHKLKRRVISLDHTADRASFNSPSCSEIAVTDGHSSSASKIENYFSLMANDFLRIYILHASNMCDGVALKAAKHALTSSPSSHWTMDELR